MTELIIKDTNSPRELHDSLLAVVAISKKSYVVLGKILYELRKDDRFKEAVGKGADTWEDYLRQPEIHLSTGEAKRMMDIYEEFVIRLGYDEDTVGEVPVKNMHYLLPLVKKLKSRDQADELVADATLLTQRDFKEKIYDKKKEQMGLSATRTLEYMIMSKTLETSTLNKVPGITSEMIKQAFNLE